MITYPIGIDSRYYIGNGGEAYSISQISRKIQIGKEVFETSYPDDLYSKNLIGFTSERYILKIAIDFIEFGVNNYLNKEDSEKPANQVSLLKSIFNDGVPVSSLRGTLNNNSAYSKSIHIDYAIDNFIILYSKNDIERKNLCLTGLMYNVSNQAEIFYNQSLKRNEEHIRQGEHIISGLKSGECMFYL
jgi:hypothetical protein